MWLKGPKTLIYLFYFLCQTLVSELPYKILRTTPQIGGRIVSEAMFVGYVSINLDHHGRTQSIILMEKKL